eukprot:scaffold48707_cov65-Phaeocystis_antarctica.AAC.3
MRISWPGFSPCSSAPLPLPPYAARHGPVRPALTCSSHSSTGKPASLLAHARFQRTPRCDVLRKASVGGGGCGGCEAFTLSCSDQVLNGLWPVSERAASRKWCGALRRRHVVEGVATACPLQLPDRTAVLELARVCGPAEHDAHHVRLVCAARIDDVRHERRVGGEAHRPSLAAAWPRCGKSTRPKFGIGARATRRGGTEGGLRPQTVKILKLRAASTTKRASARRGGRCRRCMAMAVREAARASPLGLTPRPRCTRLLRYTFSVQVV